MSKPRGPYRMGLSLGYIGNIFAGGIGWQSGLSLALAWSPRPAAYIALGYDFVLPSNFRRGAAHFELRRHPVVLSGGYRFDVGRGVDIDLGLRVSIDPIVRVTDENQVAPASDPRSVYVFSGVAPIVV